MTTTMLSGSLAIIAVVVALAAGGSAGDARADEPTELADDKASAACADITTLFYLARADGLEPDELKMVRGLRGAICSGATNDDGTLYYSNGKHARIGSLWYHPNGKDAVIGSNWYYPNGKDAVIGSNWYYPNGKDAAIGSSSFYLPNGRSSSEAGLVAFVCESDDDTCEAFTDGYKAATGKVKSALLFSAVYLRHKATSKTD